MEMNNYLKEKMRISNLTEFEKISLPKLENEMDLYLNSLNSNQILKEAMRYSVDAGGKRIRPLLVLISAYSLGKKISKSDYQVAGSLELLHTYSLIHDDLPEMDNDELRRGKPTSHKKFGQAIAVLAGDGLLTASFEWLSLTDIDNDKKIKLISQLALAAGPQGMVSGQTDDILGENKKYNLEELKHLHAGKTGALLRYACIAGGILSDASDNQLELLRKYGENFGLAFQIYDDLLDVIGDAKSLGKNVHKDEIENKNTYPILLGVQGTKEALVEVLNNTENLLKEMANNDIAIDLFEQLLDYFKVRK